MKIKKTTRNTLIATLVVILLLVLALTTATFAWFSSNSSVTAGTTLFEASHDAAGGSLRIYWGDTNNGAGNTITMDAVNGMHPMCPTTLPSVGVTTLLGLRDLSYVTAPQKGEAFGIPSTATATRLSGRTVTDPPIAQNFFTIENPADTAIIGGLTIEMDSLEPDVNINNDVLRISVYQRIASSYVYVGTLCDGANTVTHYGSITEGQTIDAYAVNNFTASKKVNFIDPTPEDTSIFMAAGGKIWVTLVAWYDGQLLTSDRAGGTAQMKFTISVR